MKEIWKDVIGYEGLYQISNYGKIKSLDRILPSDGFHSEIHRKERILKGCKDRAGYLRISFSFNGIRSKTLSLHRLTAIHFINNPENKPEVNHKNGNKKDNFYKNLEWNTRSENQYHAYATGLKNPAKSTRGGKWNSRSKPIVQILKNGKTKKWGSMGEAARSLGLSRGNIWAACAGKYPQCGGFKWRYVA